MARKNDGQEETPQPKRKVDTKGLDLRRAALTRPGDNEPLPPEVPSVSAGPIDKVIELAFNPSRDKIREVTIIDRMQGRLFPVIDTTNALFLDCIKIALYRQSPATYKAVFKGEDRPAPLFNIMDEYMYRAAQWQKSVAGKNLERATDIALAETETRGPEDEDYHGSGRTGYED